MLGVVEDGRLIWYGHDMRRGEGRIPRRHLRWKAQGRRSIDRPCIRWLNGVDETLKRRGERFAQVEESEIYEGNTTRERLEGVHQLTDGNIYQEDGEKR